MEGGPMKLGNEDRLIGRLTGPAPTAVQLRDIVKRLPLRVLSPADWEHWTTWGYVIVKDAVPPENLRRLVDLLWEFQEMDLSDPSTWARPQLRDNEMTELNNSGMVEIYNHQYLWDNRQHPRVYDAFVDIWDREDLWVKIDRANLNPPNRGPSRRFEGFLHWDVDTSLVPRPIGVQGVLSLVDADVEMGGFQCVPELFRTLGDWIRAQPPGRDPWAPDPAGLEVVPVPMAAGDLLIFNSLLAHGIRPNRSEDRVRLAQYIAMRPAEQDNSELREWRIRSWHDREPPQGYAFPGDPRDWEKTRYARAVLTPLGERLLGSRSWYE
jgi:ectoine hydroxylase-related dioxygenase (phytanoyl-CoA dioxygenase family)